MTLLLTRAPRRPPRMRRHLVNASSKLLVPDQLLQALPRPAPALELFLPLLPRAPTPRLPVRNAHIQTQCCFFFVCF